MSNQIKKYEAGNAQPTLKAMVSLAKTFHISLDALVFEDGDRGPDDELKLQFEAVSHIPEEDKQVIRSLLDGMIVKHQTKQMVGGLRS